MFLYRIFINIRSEADEPTLRYNVWTLPMSSTEVLLYDLYTTVLCLFSLTTELD